MIDHSGVSERPLKYAEKGLRPNVGFFCKNRFLIYSRHSCLPLRREKKTLKIVLIARISHTGCVIRVRSALQCIAL